MMLTLLIKKNNGQVVTTNNGLPSYASKPFNILRRKRSNFYAARLSKLFSFFFFFIAPTFLPFNYYYYFPISNHVIRFRLLLLLLGFSNRKTVFRQHLIILPDCENTWFHGCVNSKFSFEFLMNIHSFGAPLQVYKNSFWFMADVVLVSRMTIFQQFCFTWSVFLWGERFGNFEVIKLG